jgi:hypothetical protein
MPRKPLLNIAVVVTWLKNVEVGQNGPLSPHYRGFTITLSHTTLGRTPLDG